MKIEEGKFYRTRGATWKVGPMSRRVTGVWGSPRWVGSWSDDGAYVEVCPDFDLVAEWTDEPEATDALEGGAS